MNQKQVESLKFLLSAVVVIWILLLMGRLMFYMFCSTLKETDARFRGEVERALNPSVSLFEGNIKKVRYDYE